MPELVLPDDPAGMSRAFLDVERSFTDRRWRDRLDGDPAGRAIAITQRHDIPEVLARVLAGRGVPPDDVPRFLAPSIRDLMPDPSRLTDMDAAAMRLADACERGEKVVVFGDYDVDGATATALLARVLGAAGLDPDIYIPDRIFEGYGPNVEAIRQIAAGGARLLVAVDCGTVSFEPFAEAALLGLDVVVIDHHQANPELPQVAALVNPNREDDLSGLGHLAAVGLVFMTCVALVRELRERGFWGADRSAPDLLGLLDLVALGTVADVVPLLGLNRAYVAKGLVALRTRDNPGLRALMDVARLDGPPEPWHLGFLLGPRINAGGRIGRADLGARLLMTDDPLEAAAIAAELDRLNRERQAIEQTTLAEAEAEAEAALGLEGKGAVTVTAGTGWHPGVVGLIAARLKERFGRPAFAIALDARGGGTGSGRSIPGVDLGRAVRRAVEEGRIVKGGGHAMAAGITLGPGQLAGFRAFLDETLAEAVEIARRDASLAVDAAITAGGINAELFGAIERAGPFGAGHPEPLFALPAHRVAFADVVGGAHVRLTLAADSADAKIGAIAFRAAGRPLGDALIAARGSRIHIVGSLARDRWQGRERIELRIVDAAATDTGPRYIR